MKRRILSLLLAGILLLPLIACNTSPAETEDTSAASISPETQPDTETEPFVPDPNDDTPIGTGIGVNPGRVTWAYNANAFTWNGSGYWWLEKNFDSAAIKQMLTDTLCQLAGETDINKALDALFSNFNERNNGTAKGYSSGEKIVVKVNLNVTGNGSADNKSIGGYYPAPVTMRALLEILVEYGVAPQDITLTDPSRTFPTYIKEMLSEGKLNGVNLIGYTDKFDVDTTKPIRWSYDFSQDNLPSYNGYATDNTSFWPTCVTEATYMINLFNLRGHNLAGFTASAKNHFGTLIPGHPNGDGSYTFPTNFRTNPPSYSGIHHYVSAVDGFYMAPAELWDLPKRDMGTYSVLVDLLSNADATGKTFLYLCDGLAATVHQGSNLSLSEKWISAPFGNGTKDSAGWTNSIFASQDPIAIDSVMLDFLLAEQAASEEIGDYKWDQVLPENGTAENYLIEAALADNAPSGTVYQDGYGNPIGSLGVHEHWNNAEDKQYHRNLGGSEGIELIQIAY